MMHPLLTSPAHQLALYGGCAMVAGVMWFYPGDFSLMLGGATAALIVGVALYDRHHRARWPVLVRTLFADVLSHLGDPPPLSIRLHGHQLPDARSTRGTDGHGVITISQGMRVLERDTDALWFVLAHEVGHHVLGHLSRGSEPAVEAQAHDTARHHLEVQADAWALALARRAGRDPAAGIRSLRVLGPIEDRILAGRSRPGTHPRNPDRIYAMQVLLDEMSSAKGPTQGHHTPGVPPATGSTIEE